MIKKLPSSSLLAIAVVLSVSPCHLNAMFESETRAKEKTPNSHTTTEANNAQKRAQSSQYTSVSILAADDKPSMSDNKSAPLSESEQTSPLDDSDIAEQGRQGEQRREEPAEAKDITEEKALLTEFDQRFMEACRQARAFTRAANEANSQEASDRAVTAWRGVAAVAAEAEGATRENPSQLEAWKGWEEKRKLSETKAIALEYYDLNTKGRQAWSTRWNRIIRGAATELWPILAHSLQEFDQMREPVGSELQHVFLEKKKKALKEIRVSLYTLSNAYANANANANAYPYAYAYANPYAYANAYAYAYANANANAYAYAYAKANANANANAYACAYASAASAATAEEADDAAELARVYIRGIELRQQENCIYPDVKTNLPQLKSQLETLEAFSREMASFERTTGASLPRVESRVESQAVGEVKKMAAELTTDSLTYVKDLNAILTKVRSEIWPEAERSIAEFQALNLHEVSAEVQQALLAEIKNNLKDCGYLYAAAALSPEAPQDQPAEAAEIMRAMAQGIMTANSNNWLNSTLKDNLLNQAEQLTRIADFLEHLGQSNFPR